MTWLNFMAAVETEKRDAQDWTLVHNMRIIIPNLTKRELN